MNLSKLIQLDGESYQEHKERVLELIASEGLILSEAINSAWLAEQDFKKLSRQIRSKKVPLTAEEIAEFYEVLEKYVNAEKERTLCSLKIEGILISSSEMLDESSQSPQEG